MTQQSLILAAESNGRLDVNFLDYSILAFYFAIVIAIGVLARRAKTTTQDLQR